MKTTILTCLLALSAAGLFAAEGEISWTPRFITVRAEGAALQRVFFTDGVHRYGISLDTETQVEAAGGGARLTYKRVASATFTIVAAPRKLDLPPDPSKLDDYREAAMAQAPEGAADFTHTEEAIDPLNINDWRSYRYTFSYNFFGRRHRQSVTFLTFPNGQQAILNVSAIEAEFADAASRSERLIRTWHPLPSVDAGLPQS